MISGLEVLIA